MPRSFFESVNLNQVIDVLKEKKKFPSDQALAQFREKIIAITDRLKNRNELVQAFKLISSDLFIGHNNHPFFSPAFLMSLANRKFPLQFVQSHKESFLVFQGKDEGKRAEAQKEIEEDVKLRSSSTSSEEVAPRLGAGN